MTLPIFSRRAALKSLGLALAIYPTSLVVSGRGRRAAQAQIRELLHGLTSEELETVKAIVARILPADENGPGALEARADQYIDRGLAGALKGSRNAYTSGLVELDALAQSMKAAKFSKLAAVDQDAVLTVFQSRSAGFFNLLRAHTVQGMFGDPYYGGNASFAGWDMIGYPGARTGVTADLQRMGRQITPNHKSAYDFGMFSNPEI